MVMTDGALFGTFNHQGGRRGGKEFRSQNWWMTMASGKAGPGQLTVTSMFSLEPATVTKAGYREIFQVGESYKKKPLVDYQHPHDFLMQLGASWRFPMGERAGLTITGAPVGEVALGPVAFMHRASAAENPTAPLSHHTFDSTHIAMGVITIGADRGPFALEGSVFRGREPDERRWDIMDPGKLDSWSSRVWYRTPRWLAQVSHGYIKEPEAPIEPGSTVRRTTASVGWVRPHSTGFTAVSLLVGTNQRRFSHSEAVMAEATHRFSGNVIYGRAERVDVETEHLYFPGLIHRPHPGELIDPVGAYTIGGVRDLAKVAGVEIAAGGDVTFYSVPRLLEFTHGENPRSFHLFFRIRPPVSSMGRMWNMVMSQPVIHSGF